MSTPLDESGGPVATYKWKAKFCYMVSGMYTSLYANYLVAMGVVTGASRLVYSVADPVVTSGLDAQNMCPFINADGGNPESTSTDQKWGTTTDWLSSLHADQTDATEETDPTNKFLLENVISAQYTEWSEFQIRQSANKFALENLVGVVDGKTWGEDIVKTGPFAYGPMLYGMTPPLTVGECSTTPIIGSTQYFWSGGVPANPADSTGSVVTVGYLLTGEGTVAESRTSGLIVVQKTFTKRWRIDKVKVTGTVTNVVDKEYTPATWTDTWTFYTGGPSMTGTSTVGSMEAAADLVSKMNGIGSFTTHSGAWTTTWSGPWTQTGASTTGGKRTEYNSLTQQTNVWYNEGVAGAYDTTYSPPVSGEYHTETLGATATVAEIEVEAKQWLYTLHMALPHNVYYIGGFSYDVTFGPVDITSIGNQQQAFLYNYWASRMYRVLYLGSQSPYANPNLSGGPYVYAYLTPMAGVPSGGLHYYKAGQGPPSEGFSTGFQTYTVHDLVLAQTAMNGTYFKLTGSRTKFVCTEETGVFGISTFVAQVGA